MSGWAWMIWTGVGLAAVLAAVSGGLLIAFALAGQRGAVRFSRVDDDSPHGPCDCCGYELAGLEEGYCPECGWEYADNRRVPLWRRLRAAGAGLALLLCAGAGAIAPDVARHDVWFALPDAALIAAFPFAPMTEDGAFPSSLFRQLQARVDARRIDGWERRFLAARTVSILNHSGSEKRRDAAARLITSLADAAAGETDGLLAALNDPSHVVRSAAVSTLAGVAEAEHRAGRRCDAAVQGLMGAAVCDRDQQVRRQAVDALARVGAANLPRAAAGVFAAATRDPSAPVRARAMYAMSGRPAPSHAAGAAHDLTTAAIGSHDPHASVREAAVCVLGRLAESLDSAVLLLAVSLRDQSVEVRQSAACCLARLGRRAAPAWPALTASLEDSDAAVRASAAVALGAIGAMGS